LFYAFIQGIAKKIIYIKINLERVAQAPFSFLKNSGSDKSVAG
jgi:hypothetical protein